jgi:class 3 adenylate cyclase
MRSDLPSGTVTFLFTDVEGSTRLLHELGEEAFTPRGGRETSFDQAVELALTGFSGS